MITTTLIQKEPSASSNLVINLSILPSVAFAPAHSVHPDIQLLRADSLARLFVLHTITKTAKRVSAYKTHALTHTISVIMDAASKRIAHLVKR